MMPMQKIVKMPGDSNAMRVLRKRFCSAMTLAESWVWLVD
jgi:hypothetical protein